MTPAQYQAKMQVELDDPSLTIFSGAEIMGALDYSYKLVGCLTGCFVKQATVTLPQTPYWHIRASISDYLFLRAVYSPALSNFLQISDLKIIESQDWEWDTSSGNTTTLAPIGTEYVAVYPTMNSASNDLSVVYSAIPPTFSSETAVGIPDPFADVLIDMAMVILLLWNLEFNKVMMHYNSFLENLAKFEKYLSTRNTPDYCRRFATNAVVSR